MTRRQEKFPDGILLALIVFSADILTVRGQRSNENPTECSTSVCLATAQSIRQSMNAAVNPCDDFYEYSCGRWISEHRIPNNETEAGKFKELDEKMKVVVQGLLNARPPGMLPSEIKIKEIFKQCQNQAEIEALGAKPLIALLNDTITGGWPILSPNWVPEEFDFIGALLKARQVGVEPFFQVEVKQDLRNPVNNLIYVSEPDTFIPKDVLMSESASLITHSYSVLMNNVTTALLREVGDQRDVTAVAGELADLVEMGKSMAMIHQTSAEREASKYSGNKSSLREAEASVPFFKDFTSFFQRAFEPVGLSSSITEDTEILIRDRQYFDKMYELMGNITNLAEAGQRRLANYVGWRIIERKLRDLSKPYRNAWNEHEQRRYGEVTTPETSAAERCANNIAETFPLALGVMYVRDRVPPQLKSKASLMLADLKLGFRELLTEATWMDNATYLHAVSKLDAMLMVVGYPDLLAQNASAIDDLYKSVEIKPTFFATLQGMSAFRDRENLQKLRKPNMRVDPLHDPIDITTLNAFNREYRNLMVIYAAMLQPPVFDTDRPQYLNFGAVGLVIGHEITHGFDNHGAGFDNDGVLRSWWTDATLQAYKARTKGFVEQYNAFQVPTSEHINGELTLNENIADNGGLKAAYRAYFHYYRKLLPRAEPLLPGMPTMTAERLFFLAAAQVWCSKKRPEAERYSLLTESHSPDKFRVLGPMMNMPEFAEAYKCPLGSKMNPAVKRAVW
ncbi:Endothelin-converting enzyme 1 [Hypsibius exemplaris]|uniref:Endothelin-converting enzyme 1 n=1 Tax=Hypsibius exemplaris TaxID=2072580 RepID=A0A9X6RKE0_HYPEX|nr:Endothelin-converting enzyme 1 [Hypsibius exemplaris]